MGGGGPGGGGRGGRVWRVSVDVNEELKFLSKIKVGGEVGCGGSGWM